MICYLKFTKFIIVNSYTFKKELDNKELSLENSESYSKKIIKPSNDELEKHKKFIKDNFKRNFF